MNVKNKNRPGYKKTQLGWLPQGWSFSPLGEVLESSQYGCNAPSAENGNTPVVGMKDIRNGRLVLSNLARVSLTEGDQFRFLLEPGDVLINRTNSYDLVGKVGIFDSSAKVAFVSYLVRLRGQKEMLNQQFLTFWLNSFPGRKSIKRIATKGVSQANINPTELRKQCRLPLPPLPEQEAIAGVLECWDKAIRGYEKKIEKKRNIKKGLMQVLLSGKIRLPGFGTTEHTEVHGKGRSGIPVGWKEVRLEDVCSMKSGETITSRSIYDKAKYPCFGGNGLRGYTTTFTHDGTFILIGRQGALCGNVHLVSGKFYASEHAIVATLSETTDPLWFAEALKAKKLNRHTESSAQPELSVSKVLRIRVLAPPPFEQQAIAAVISDADAEVEALDRKLACLQDQKRFLLNNLVTGTIRLPEFCDHGKHGIARK